MTKTINFGTTQPKDVIKQVAVGYCRLSKTEMRDHRYDSIQHQKESITEYAKNNDITLLRFYEEIRSVGKKRYVFDEMMTDAKKKEFNLILVKDWDRFDRIYERLRSAEKTLTNLGIGITAISYPDIKGIPKKFLQFSGDIYRDIVSEKIIAEKDKQWRMGRNMNKPPLGYKKRRHKGFIVTEPEAQIIRDLFNDFLSSKFDLKTLGKRFEMSPKVVKQRLVCRTYIGDLGYKNDWKESQHTPIISKEIFEAVQKRFKNGVRRSSNDIYSISNTS